MKSEKFIPACCSIALILLALGCRNSGQTTPVSTEILGPVAVPAGVTGVPAGATEVPAVTSPLKPAAELPSPVPSSPSAEIKSSSPQATHAEAPAPPPAMIEIAPGDSMFQLNYSGLERNYLLHIPANYDPAKPSSVVLVYHGFTLDSDEMVRMTGFSELSEEIGFVVAYPNGSGSRQSWNGGYCCGEATSNDVDDVGFTRALIDDLAGKVNLDRKRVYATGFSNGAIMVYRLACDLAD